MAQFTARRSIAVTLTALLLPPLVLMAAENNGLQVEDAWARATAPGSPNGAGYLTLHNLSDRTQTLTGAQLDGVERVEIHRSSMEDGMGRMEKIRDGIPIASHETLTLAPKGYHLMLLDLAEPLKAGDEHELTLHIEPAGEIRTTLTVRAHDSDGGQKSHHHH
ncbi:MAG: copper chaperone PCu(A)C [Oleiphilaceae bacterium]|nr:copper chaperone PCu(A)C [Oleiphilaceae bacterium]